MKIKSGLIFFAMFAMLLTGCGGSPVAMKNILVYPDAKEIAQNDSQLFNGVSQLAKNDTTLQFVLNAKEKKIYRLPNNAAWTDVKFFYEKNFDDSEWQLIPPTTALLEKVNLPNDISSYNAEMWTRGNQTVAIAQVNSPQYVELFVGLTSP